MASDAKGSVEVVDVPTQVFVAVVYLTFVWGMHWFAAKVEAANNDREEWHLSAEEVARRDEEYLAWQERVPDRWAPPTRGWMVKRSKIILFDGTVLSFVPYMLWRNSYLSLYFDGHRLRTRQSTDEIGRGVFLPWWLRGAHKWRDPLSGGCTCWRLYWSWVWPKFKRDARDIPQSIRRAVFAMSMGYTISLAVPFSTLIATPKVAGYDCAAADVYELQANCDVTVHHSVAQSLLISALGLAQMGVLNKLGDCMQRA